MDKIKEFFENQKVYRVTIILGIIFMSAVMIKGSIVKQLWYDEMATIGFMRSDVSFSKMVDYYLNIEASNLPLYQIIVFVFYRLLPAEEMFVRLPSIIMAVIGVVLLAKLADKVYGRIASYTVLIFSVVSTTTITRIGILVRAYSLMYMSAVLSLYALYKVKENNTLKNKVCLTLALLLLVYSHYFGTLLFGLLGLVTLAYIILKKGNIKSLLPFVIAGVLFSPWFFMAMKTRTADVSDFWIAPPGITKPVETLGFLLGGNLILTAIYCISFITIAILLIRRKEVLSYKMMITLLPAIIIGGIFVYSHIGGSLYEDRYFIILVPELLLTIGAFFQELVKFKLVQRYLLQTSIIISLIYIAIVATSLIRTFDDAFSIYIRYTGASDYIIEQNDISKDDTLLIIREDDEVDEIVSLGWYDFYLYRHGYVAGNMEVRCGGATHQTYIMDEYEKPINKVYVIAPEYLTGYEGTMFEEVFSDELYKITVYERVPENEN